MKKLNKFQRAFSAAVILAFLISGSAFAAKPEPRLRLLGTYSTGIYDEGAAEIVAHDPGTQRLFVVNGADSTIDVLDASNPAEPAFLFAIDVSPWGDQANSVDVYGGLVAAAVQADVKTDNGKIVFFDTAGNYVNDVPAGALPDMVTFTPNGEWVLSANEGEPNSYGQSDSVDPEGSVTIVDLRKGVSNATVRNIGFTDFNGQSLDESVRIFGPGATVAQDLEPEYIAVDHNSKTAWVTLQENNAIAILDIRSGQITGIVGLGFKDHSDPANKLDASDQPTSGTPRGTINIANWPVRGMYLPDTIAASKYENETFLVTANEGDARDYTGFAEEVRVSSLPLATDVFGDVATLKLATNLGRLNVTSTMGNTDGDADREELYSFGGRSFSIWNSKGEQIFDSGDDFEQITADIFPNFFNASNTNNNRDSRSTSKGPEPEAVSVGKAYGRTYAFIGLERMGGIMVYEITDPYQPRFIQYINNRDFTAATNSAAAKDLGPEGIHFISEEESPTGVPLIAVANEISGTTSIYEFVPVD